MSMAPIGGLSPWAKRKQSVWRGSISEASGVTPQEPMKVENTYRYMIVCVPLSVTNYR